MKRPDERTVAAQVAALQAMTVADLRVQYLGLFGEETKSRNKTWLFRACAWRLQELAFGGLSERAKQRAKEIVRESDVRPRRREVPPLPGTNAKVIPFEPQPVSNDPLPGTVLTRQYKDREIRVRVLDEGYEYEGQPYRSLSAVAKAVTGSHWNGRAFFHLKKGGA
ncbi:MAG: DUF2924 domain-containing protein [Vicinamibacterales bacterium]